MTATNVQKNQVITGSRVKLQINNQLVGYATVASYVETITYEPVAVLDLMEIAEHVPVAYDVAFTASRVFFKTETLKGKMKMFPQRGSNNADLLNNLVSIGAQGQMTAVIIDANGDAIVTLQGVKVTSHNLTFGARAVVGEDITFVAIRALDKLAGET